MESYANIFAIFYVIAGGQGIFLWFLFYANKKGRREANLILGFLIGMFSLQLFSYSLAYSKILLVYPHLWGLTGDLPLLYGPLLYLYFRAILLEGKLKFNWWNILHFLPFIGHFILRSKLLFLDAKTKHFLLETFIYSEKTYAPSHTTLIVHFLIFLQLFIYLFLIIRLYQQYPQKNLNTFNWLKAIIFFFSLYILFFIGHDVVIFLQMGYYHALCHCTKVFMALGMYSVGYIGFIHPEKLNFQSIKDKIKYKKSHLSPSQVEQLAHKIEAFMKENKPYLQEGFNLSKLSELLEIPSHYISQVINDQFQQNFSNYLHSYRIEQAKKMLLEQPDKKILAIAFDCGFSNKVTFNVTFKKITGLSPSQYRLEAQSPKN